MARKNQDYAEKGVIKGLIDETFLLQYLTVNNINKEEDVIKDAKEKTLSRMLDRIIDLNPELTKKELQDKLAYEIKGILKRLDKLQKVVK